MKTAVQTSLTPPAQTMFSSWVGRKVPPIVEEALRSPGQPLDTETRAFMEPRFNHNFGNVRVHNDTKSADSARAVSAHAYTVGEQVVFGANQFAPMSHQGRELLAHELAHTIQQRSLATDSPLVHADGTIESTASAAARTVSSGQALSSRLPATGIRLSRQPIGATEDVERARLEAEAQATLAREDELESKWKKQEAEESEQKAARQQKLFPQVSSPLKGMPLLSDEEIPEKKRRENEDRANKARFAQDVKESHDRLLELGEKLRGSGYGYSKDAIIRKLKKDPLLELQLRRYGLEWPHWYTRRKTFYYEVLDAIDKFDAAWRKTYGGGSAPGLSELTGEKLEALQAEQSRQENVAAGAEGLQAIERSPTAGFAAWGASFFTKDIKTIAAVGEAGESFAGIVAPFGAAKATQIEQKAAAASAEKNVLPPAAEIAPKPTSEPIPTPDLPPSSSATEPAVSDVPVPYAPGRPLDKTQPDWAFEKTQPGASPTPSGASAPIPYAPGRPLDDTQPGMAFEKTQPGGPPPSGPSTQFTPPPGGGRKTLRRSPPPMPGPAPSTTVDTWWLFAAEPAASFKNDPVTVEVALRTLETNPELVIKSGSTNFHNWVWTKTFGHTDKAPDAFSYGDLIYLDIDSLSPAQKARVKATIRKP